MPNDSKLATAFIESTIYVLQAQCQTKLENGPLISDQAKREVEPFDIAAVIGVNSTTLNGSVAMCLSEKAFLTLISRMLGEEFKVIDKDLEDGAAELLNTIFGRAKKALNENGHSIAMSLPTVVRGSGLSVNQTRARETVVIPFRGDGVSFFMEIGIDNA